MAEIVSAVTGVVTDLELLPYIAAAIVLGLVGAFIARGVRSGR